MKHRLAILGLMFGMLTGGSAATAVPALAASCVTQTHYGPATAVYDADDTVYSYAATALKVTSWVSGGHCYRYYTLSEVIRDGSPTGPLEYIDTLYPPLRVWVCGSPINPQDTIFYYNTAGHAHSSPVYDYGASWCGPQADNYSHFFYDPNWNPNYAYSYVSF